MIIHLVRFVWNRMIIRAIWVRSNHGRLTRRRSFWFFLFEILKFCWKASAWKCYKYEGHRVVQNLMVQWMASTSQCVSEYDTSIDANSSRRTWGTTSHREPTCIKEIRELRLRRSLHCSGGFRSGPCGGGCTRVMIECWNPADEFARGSCALHGEPSNIIEFFIRSFQTWTFTFIKAARRINERKANNGRLLVSQHELTLVHTASLELFFKHFQDLLHFSVWNRRQLARVEHSPISKFLVGIYP